MFWMNQTNSGGFAWESAPRCSASRGKASLVALAPSEHSASSTLTVPAHGHHQNLSEGPEVVLYWALRLCRALLPRSHFPWSGRLHPPVGRAAPWWLWGCGCCHQYVDGRGRGAHGDEAEVGCARCPSAARSGAETASPGVCHCLMKMDLELLGDGWEKDGKEPSEMEKRTRFP